MTRRRQSAQRRRWPPRGVWEWRMDMYMLIEPRRVGFYKHAPDGYEWIWQSGREQVHLIPIDNATGALRPLCGRRMKTLDRNDDLRPAGLRECTQCWGKHLMGVLGGVNT